MSYVEELEQQNEKLKEMLAFATQDRYVIKWNQRSDENYNSTYRCIYEMRVHGFLYALILENKHMFDGAKERYNCVYKNFALNDKYATVAECMDRIVKHYKNIFMDEPTI